MWKFFSPLKVNKLAVTSVIKWSLARRNPGSTYVACLMTLDFSSRYSEILAPITAPVGVNFISRYLPKRLELSFIAVQAFPKASTRGFTCRIFSRSVRLFAWEQQTLFFNCSSHLTFIFSVEDEYDLFKKGWPRCYYTFPKKVRCWTIKWALSVFPAPLSPLIMMHWNK